MNRNLPHGRAHIKYPPSFAPSDVFEINNVSATAREWGLCFGMYIQTQILSRFAGGSGDDDDGSLLVGSIVEAVDRCLNGRTGFNVRAIGLWLFFDFFQEVRTRPACAPATVHLRASIGPCTDDNPAVFIQCVSSIRPSTSLPKDGFA